MGVVLKETVIKQLDFCNNFSVSLSVYYWIKQTLSKELLDADSPIIVTQKVTKANLQKKEQVLGFLNSWLKTQSRTCM